MFSIGYSSLFSDEESFLDFIDFLKFYVENDNEKEKEIGGIDLSMFEQFVIDQMMIGPVCD